MRGHGAVVVGENLPRAVGRSIYLELSARMQMQALALAGPGGEIIYLDEAEVQASVPGAGLQPRLAAVARQGAEAGVTCGEAISSRISGAVAHQSPRGKQAPRPGRARSDWLAGLRDPLVGRALDAAAPQASRRVDARNARE